jgi:glycosyltransferase involved in cell wall biosynthesis
MLDMSMADGHLPSEQHARRGGRLWIDLTMLRNHRFGNAVGMTRVERNLAAACADLLGADAHFMARDRGLRRFVSLDGAAGAQLLALRGAGPTRARAGKRQLNSSLRRLGRTLERALRHFRRGPLRRAVCGIVPGLAPPAPDVRPGDGVLFLGDLWTHHDCAALRAWLRAHGLSMSVLLYDLTPVLFPHWYPDPALPARFAAYLDMLRTEADLVMAISESTRRDFLAWCEGRGAVRPHVATIRLGDDRPADPPHERPAKFAALEAGRYVLSVSTIQVRKNYDLLYALWRRLLERASSEAERRAVPALVIAGRRGWLAGDLTTLMAADPLTRDHIFVADDPSDAELAWLYRHCRFTAYPSLYEGWGLPIAESFAHGKPCVASASSSMPEVSRGLAIHLDPLDFASWYRELESLLADDARLAALAARVQAEFRLRRWDEAAEDLLALVQGQAQVEAVAVPAVARAAGA